MKKLTLEQLFGLIRHILTIVGTILVITGTQIDDSMWQIVTGSVLGLAATLWSIFSKTSTNV